jgi:hypothetical protein
VRGDRQLIIELAVDHEHRAAQAPDHRQRIVVLLREKGAHARRELAEVVRGPHARRQARRAEPGRLPQSLVSGTRLLVLLATRVVAPDRPPRCPDALQRRLVQRMVLAQPPLHEAVHEGLRRVEGSGNTDEEGRPGALGDQRPHPAGALADPPYAHRLAADVGPTAQHGDGRDRVGRESVEGGAVEVPLRGPGAARVGGQHGEALGDEGRRGATQPLVFLGGGDRPRQQHHRRKRWGGGRQPQQPGEGDIAAGEAQLHLGSGDGNSPALLLRSVQWGGNGRQRSEQQSHATPPTSRRSSL